MATDVQLYNLLESASSDFVKRCVMRLHKLARDVKNEDAGTPNHANRLLWAASVFADPLAMANKMKWDIMADEYVYAAEEPGSVADDGWRSAKVQDAASALIDLYAQG